MRQCNFGLLSILLTGRLAFCQSSAISITVDGDSADHLQVTVTNRSKSQQFFGSARPITDYSIAVETSEGGKVAMKKECQVPINGVWMERAAIIQLQPGESYVDTLNLSECFDLKPGIVTVSVSRELSAIHITATAKPFRLTIP